MRKILLIITMTLLLSAGLVNAVTQEEISQAKSLVDSKVDCKVLSDSQLELIGEYFMEQMHPGEAHELMHKMMGLKEGSQEEKQFHVNMAKAMYCNESTGMMGSEGMMGMMGSTGMMGIMGGGMMSGQAPMSSGMMQGMTGNYWNYGFELSVWNILYVILIIGLIILTYLGIIKLWKDLFKSRRR
ncbi:MAG: hypothetical protein AB1467_00220 [Candidatus Diapherotrites archaeon]